MTVPVVFASMVSSLSPTITLPTTGTRLAAPGPHPGRINIAPRQHNDITANHTRGANVSGLNIDTFPCPPTVPAKFPTPLLIRQFECLPAPDRRHRPVHLDADRRRD